MYIEDLITHLIRGPSKLNSWDEKIAFSFFDQICQGRGLTEKQANLILKILKRQAANISFVVGKDINPFLETPQYKMPMRQISMVKKMSIIDDNTYTRAIKVEFPYNDAIINSIKEFNNFQQKTAQWDKEQKAWIFALNEQNLLFLQDLSIKEKFDTDEELQGYFAQINEIIKNIEKYVPILVAENDGVKIRNFPQNLPIFPSENILKSVFEARKLGVFTWDETISSYLNNQISNPVVKTFLDQDPGENIHVDCEKTEIFALRELIEYMSPTLFVLPGGSELEKLQLSYELLKSIGVDNSKISVMFRLSREIDTNFNDFVKINNLNNPITNDTAVVFVSSKFPKPVLKSSIKFHLVINMGQNNVHYTMRDFIKNHENLVFFSETQKQQELPFWLLAK
jgi:hypothetical protein